MQPIETNLISRIYGRGRGWTFTKTDFAAEFGEDNIPQALSSLWKAGRIRRICRGVYDYPRYSDLLRQPLSPDIDQAAHALGRKFNWRIQPSGVAALKALGQERVDTAVMQAIRARLWDKGRDRIPRDTRQITGWVTRTLARPFEGGSVIKLIKHAYNTQQIPLTAIWPIRCLR